MLHCLSPKRKKLKAVQTLNFFMRTKIVTQINIQTIHQETLSEIKGEKIKQTRKEL